MNRDAVAEAVERLRAELARTQTLDNDRVLSICQRRELSGTQIAEVRTRLRAEGLLREADLNARLLGKSIRPRRRPLDRRAPLFPKDLTRCSMLTSDEERSLSRRVRAMTELRDRLRDAEATPAEQSLLDEGGEAYEELVLANVRLVARQARRARRRGRTLEESDLFQEGVFGLLRAVERFDATAGFRFATYGSWLIMSSIEEAFVERNRTIRWPRSAVRSHVLVQKARDKLIADTGTDPHLSELSDATGVSPARIVAMSDWAHVTSSLDGPTSSTVEVSLGHTVTCSAKTPEELVIDADEAARLHQAISTLDTRTARIIRLRYGIEDGRPWTQNEIADEIELTESRISQIESKTLGRLRRRLEPRERIHSSQ